MYMRAVTIRIVYVGIMSAGILLSAAFRQSTVEAAPVAAVKPHAATVANPALPVTTLATVHVTAKAIVAKPIVAQQPAVHDGPVVSESAIGARAGGSLPSLRLDMPYYSVGKLLPRVGKE